MNIFVLDTDPVVAARMMCNKHVVKMIVETAQILSTVMNKHGKEGPYKSTHANHPCTIWAETSLENYEWLFAHGMALCFEYTHRYEKIHKCQEYFEKILIDAPELPVAGLTEFKQVVPEQHKREGNAVEAYRQYYIHDKARFAKWKIRETPTWFIEGTMNEN